MNEENKNITPPPFDPNRRPEPTPWYKRKEIVIGIVLAVLVLCAGAAVVVSTARFVTSRSITTIDIAGKAHDYRLLNEAGEYIVSETADVYDQPEGKKTGASHGANDLVWCTNTAYIDETEGLWGQTDEGWILIRDEDGTYASENILTETDDGAGTIEAAKEIVLYDDPSESAPQAGTLAKGETAAYTAIFRDLVGHEWYELESGAWVPQNSSVKTVSTTEKTETKENGTDETQETAEEEETIPTPFVAKYAMKVRSEPNLDAKQVGSIKENETVTIVELKDGDNESVWGRLENGNWVCMQDKEYTYFEQAEEKKEETE